MKKNKFTIIKFVIAALVVVYVATFGNLNATKRAEEQPTTEERKTTERTTEEISSGEGDVTDDVTTDVTDEIVTEISTTEMVYDEAQVYLRQMTLEEKVGMLFIVRPEALQKNATFLEINDTDKYGVTSLSPEMKETLENYHIGGVVLFRKNVTSPSQLSQFTADLQEGQELPLLIGIDEEGGEVTRIASVPGFNVPTYASMEAVGSSQNAESARKVGEDIGGYLKEYGLNLDFAPVADVNTNSSNIVIGNRAFGSDPNLVANMVASEIVGFHNKGILTSAKHFPGHGDTVEDTHVDYVKIDKTWDDLQYCELIPFRAAISANTDFIMVAHISTPNITSDGLPASLSKEMVTGKLRGELGYEGIIITDSLSMGAIRKNYTSEEAAVLAFEAGADVLLMPEDFEVSYNAILDAVKSGRISEDRLDESVLRIIKVKQKLVN